MLCRSALPRERLSGSARSASCRRDLHGHSRALAWARLSAVTAQLAWSFGHRLVGRRLGRDDFAELLELALDPLLFGKNGVNSAVFAELVVGTAFHHVAFFEHDDLVAVRRGRNAVGD